MGGVHRRRGTGATREEINQDEDLLLLYISHLTTGMGWGADTVKQKLGVIAREHVFRGLGDPLQWMDRIRVALQKLRREQGALERKLPAGPKEIAEAKKLRAEWDLNEKYQVVLAAALESGFGFMLRAGKSLYRDFEAAPRVIGDSIRVVFGFYRGFY